MSVDVAGTAEAIEAMASRLREGAADLDAVAARMRASQDLELAGDALSVIANLVPNLRLDLLVARPLKAVLKQS